MEAIGLKEPRERMRRSQWEPICAQEKLMVLKELSRGHTNGLGQKCKNKKMPRLHLQSHTVASHKASLWKCG